MATVEALQDLRNYVMTEFQKVATLQEDHRVKVQEVVDVQVKADQAGVDHHRWKMENESRMLRQDSQQSTMASIVAELVAKVEKLEKSSVGQSPDATRGKDKWQLTRPKDMDPAEFSGKEEECFRWTEETEDYVDAVRPGLKQALSLAAKPSQK